MNFTKSLCVGTFLGTILFSSIVTSDLRAAEEPFTCPLDTNNVFLGNPVFDVQGSITPAGGEAEVDGKKVALYHSTSLQVAQNGSILLFWSQNETGFIYQRFSRSAFRADPGKQMSCRRLY